MNCEQLAALRGKLFDIATDVARAETLTEQSDALGRLKLGGAAFRAEHEAYRIRTDITERLADIVDELQGNPRPAVGAPSQRVMA
jgi:hypothetical protein